MISFVNWAGCILYLCKVQRCAILHEIKECLFGLKWFGELAMEIIVLTYGLLEILCNIISSLTSSFVCRLFGIPIPGSVIVYLF